MIYSMTGFAAAASELESGSLTIELRAVNHRYLDLQIRLPDELRTLEPALREASCERLTRGKVECRISFNARQSGEEPAQLNEAMLKQLAQLNSQVQEVLPDARSLGVADVLRWNGVLQVPTLSADALRISIMDLLRQVLDDFTNTRGREGEKLKAFILQRVGQIEVLCDEVAPRIPAVVAAYEEKLATRLRAAMQGGDEERLQQEIAVFGTKVDVEEELSRLRTHLIETKRTLDKGGAAGKRLDFLMQELHREANTLGSKSADAEVSRASMEMKLLIEQMREQVQNIE